MYVVPLLIVILVVLNLSIGLKNTWAQKYILIGLMVIESQVICMDDTESGRVSNSIWTFMTAFLSIAFAIWSVKQNADKDGALYLRIQCTILALASILRVCFDFGLLVTLVIIAVTIFISVLVMNRKTDVMSKLLCYCVSCLIINFSINLEDDGSYLLILIMVCYLWLIILSKSAKNDESIHFQAKDAVFAINMVSTVGLPIITTYSNVSY